MNGVNDTKDRKYNESNILIDTGSTLSVFNNSKMLINIRRSRTRMRAYTNDGYQDSVYKGDFPGFFTVWYNPASMMNILAWRDVRRRFRITVDTDVDNGIHMHLKDGRNLDFMEVESGLYMFKAKNNVNKAKVSAYSTTTYTS